MFGRHGAIKLLLHQTHMPAVQVHVPLYDPSTVMLLAVCSTQQKVHKACVLTRAVRSIWAQVTSLMLFALFTCLLAFCSLTVSQAGRHVALAAVLINSRHQTSSGFPLNHMYAHLKCSQHASDKQWLPVKPCACSSEMQAHAQKQPFQVQPGILFTTLTRVLKQNLQRNPQGLQLHQGCSLDWT